jgi:uncharacterized protein YfcZ (UPF0381/DUF406 family)
MNAKQIDAAGFLAHVTSHSACACAALAMQMVDEECLALIELRDRTVAEANTLLEQFAQRRANVEASKISEEHAAIQEAADAKTKADEVPAPVPVVEPTPAETVTTETPTA